MKRKFYQLLMMTMIASFFLTGCLDDDDFVYDDEDGYYEDYEGTQDGYSGSGGNGSSERISSSSSVLSVDGSSGAMTITRPQRDLETPMGESDTWTIFVYLCGADLESEGGMATDDLNEMLSAQSSDQVRFVVETGGASAWYMDGIERNQIQRFVIQNQDITEVYSSASADMGDVATITDFLRWGVEEYPAERMGVVFWDHGSGSINGVCFDENHQGDSLSLLEIDSALYSIYDEMTDRFEFVGFDACLMGTVETANILASYSRYMYGSEETEPGSGWDYTEIGNYLAANPGADGQELGKVVCDSFLAACKAQDDDELTTLSVIDLEKLDDALVAFNSFAKSMYEAGEDAGTLSAMIREIEEADNFGGNNKSEGYTNMVDLGGLIEACASYSSGAGEALSSLEQVITYQVTGSAHSNASGLAIYYPLSIQGSSELSIFESVCVSPYYMSFVDRQDFGSVCSVNYDYEYDDDVYDNNWNDDDDYCYDDSLFGSFWFEDDDWYDDSWWMDDDECWENYCEYEYDDSCSCYRRKSVSTSHWTYADNFEQTGESKLITFAKLPHMDADGIYTFTLSARGIENAEAVYAYIFEMSEDGEDLIELGETFDIDGDWDTGIFSDGFDGYWLSLPDGQNLATYIVDYDDSGIIYTSPILLNGEETNLRLRQDLNGTVTIEGTWDGLDDNGAASKKITKFKSGDIIIPIYFSLNSDTLEEDVWQGVEYQIEGTPEIYYSMLDSADYYYSFCIDDIYHDYYMTDFETFHLDDAGEIWFYTE